MPPLNYMPMCPECGALLDAHAGHPAPPVVGDVTVCAYCVTPLEYGARALQVANVATLHPETQEAIRKASEMILQIMRTLGRTALKRKHD